MMTMQPEFNKCSNELCFRKVKQGIAYCCNPCGLAAEKKYEIHESGPLGHTPDCNERDILRGTISPRDVLYYTTFIQ
jgi:hypothetical protein